ncbi:PTS sugar transporter subunit IIA [Enterococcus sp. LJL51]|uniref:PTS sugar transporter subunit IIA n=1 Tax=Enterococcus sp. LJL51 TaxID=3416656 RepID=UPI003CEDB93D
MTKVILVAHGCLAVEMKNSLEMIFGKADDFFPVVFNTEDGLDSLEEKLRYALADAETALIITDLYCGTPFNASCSLAMKESTQNIQVLSGMSLPMVLEIAGQLKIMPINEIVCKIKEMIPETVKLFSKDEVEDEEEL